MEKIDIIFWILGTGFSFNFALMWVFYKTINEKIDKGFEKVDQKFEKIDQKFEKVDIRFDKVEEKITDIDRRLCRIEGALSAKEYFVHTINKELKNPEYAL